MITNIKKQHLNWLKKAVNKDEARPALQAISVSDKLESADGFKILRLNYQLTNQQGEVIEGLFLPRGDTLEPDTREGIIYPDLDQIIPITPVMTHNNPKGETNTEACFCINVNAKFLADTLSGLSGMVTFVFTGDTHPFEIFGHTKDYVEAYALVMPMQTEVDKLWRSNSNILKIKNKGN